MGIETTLISALSFGLFVLAALLAGHATLKPNPPLRYATLVHGSREKGAPHPSRREWHNRWNRT